LPGRTCERKIKESNNAGAKDMTIPDEAYCDRCGKKVKVIYNLNQFVLNFHYEENGFRVCPGTGQHVTG